MATYGTLGIMAFIGLFAGFGIISLIDLILDCRQIRNANHHTKEAEYGEQDA